MSIVCLGEALVDLIGSPAGGPPRRFDVHFGGALANVSVAIARAGSPAALAGGVGNDEFGWLLRADLKREGVNTDRLYTIPGFVTPHAFVHVDQDGEPSYRIGGDGIDEGLAPLAGREGDLVDVAEGLVCGSNTLTSDPGREVTLAAVDAAHRAGVPVLFDPNLRPRRWRDLDEALDRCRALVDGCLVVKCNLWEARKLLGDESLDAPAAASSLAALGAELAVITAGSAPAVAAGAAGATCEPDPVADPQPIGAGDAVMGTLAAGLREHGWEPAAIAEVLPTALEAGADACRRPGAIA